MSKAEFVEGMIAKKGYWNKEEEPHLKISFKTEEFIEWLKANTDKGWCNVEVKTSKKGNVFVFTFSAEIEIFVILYEGSVELLYIILQH